MVRCQVDLLHSLEVGSWLELFSPLLVEDIGWREKYPMVIKWWVLNGRSP